MEPTNKQQPANLQPCFGASVSFRGHVNLPLVMSNRVTYFIPLTHMETAHFCVTIVLYDLGHWLTVLFAGWLPYLLTFLLNAGWLIFLSIVSLLDRLIFWMALHGWLSLVFSWLANWLSCLLFDCLTWWQFQQLVVWIINCVLNYHFNYWLIVLPTGWHTLLLSYILIDRFVYLFTG